MIRVVDPRERADLEPETAASGVGLATLDQLGATLVEPRRHGAAVVVASQGHYDEEALGAALKAGAQYIGLVASRKRGATVLAQLTDAGVKGVNDVHIPAGLDIGARTPPEVALSIFAEMVSLQPAALGPQPSAEIRQPSAVGLPPSPPATAIDPVCQMEVEIAGARHTAEVEGVTYYFCCGGCRSAFLKQPHQFLAQNA